MIPTLLSSLVLLAGVPTMEHARGERAGFVVAAPHEGFDEHTEPLARAVAEALGWGWVVARDFRATKERRWVDVNRPTQRVWEGSKRGPARETEDARRVYEVYQRRLIAAAGDRAAPLTLLVELHGHARTIEREDGERTRLQSIELATAGFTRGELRALKARYERLVRELPPEDRVPLAVEQLDREYEVDGVQVRYYFRASGAKQNGSLRPAAAQRALHFELPQKVRFSEERRARYAALLAELLRPLAGD